MDRAEMLHRARRLYADAPPLIRALQSLRPHVCPFDGLLPLVPPGSRVLDVGCGAGLFLALLADSNRIGSGVGVDASEPAIRAAARMARDRSFGSRLEFRHQTAVGGIPQEPFDVVSLIDVLHHVPPHAQKRVVLDCARAVAPGGRLLFKDIAPRPRWMAAANRLHDLVVARQWIWYRDPAEVAEWMAEAGLQLSERRQIRRLWYAHELLVGIRTG